MRAVLYTGGKKVWTEALGERSWVLLPVGGRPLLSYWLELCVDLGIIDVQVVLGRDAEYVEMFCGNGAQWGLHIDYSFIRAEDDPHAYLLRNPERWADGLLYMDEAVFPRRGDSFSPEKIKTLLDGCYLREDGRIAFFVSQHPEAVADFIRTGHCNGGRQCTSSCNGSEICRTPAFCGIDFVCIPDITEYYRLNMEVVSGEMNRYLTSGYSSHDGASIGYNVTIPPSVALSPPLAIGNDCRIGAISVIGPRTVISDHVLIDRQCEISDSIILSDTYVGRNLEIKGKIVSGNRIIDPEDGTCLEIEDPWLVSRTHPRNYLRDAVRAVFGWLIALLLAAVQITPFIVFYALIRLSGRGRFIVRACRGIGGKEVALRYFAASGTSPNLLLMCFYGASLDRLPRLLCVLTGKLWLCGQVPRSAASGEIKNPDRYFPAVFSYSDAFAEIDKQMDALYYAHTRSLAADLRILRHALFHRFIEAETVSGAAV